jgi:hypothetical protein
MTNKYNLHFIGIYEVAMPVNAFIQHIQCLVHVQLVGKVTLGKLNDALKERWADNPEKLEAAKDFYDHQVEGGASDESLIIGDTDDEESVFHFDLQKVD